MTTGCPKISHKCIKNSMEKIGKMMEVVRYESRKQELKTRPTYECRCDERLKTKSEKSTRLAYTGATGLLGDDRLRLKIFFRGLTKNSYLNSSFHPIFFILSLSSVFVSTDLTIRMR
jgi:hypothetical protein